MFGVMMVVWEGAGVGGGEGEGGAKWHDVDVLADRWVVLFREMTVVGGDAGW